MIHHAEPRAGTAPLGAQTPAIDDVAYRRVLERAGVSPDDMKLLRDLAAANDELTTSEFAPPAGRIYL